MLAATDASRARSTGLALGVLDPSFARYGLRIRDSADLAEWRAQRSNDAT